MLETQICSKCCLELTIDNFLIRADNGRRRKECKPCKKEINKKYREQNYEKLSNYDKARNLTPKRASQRRETYLRHRVKRINDVRAYYEKNKERLNSIAKLRLKSNPEKARAYWNNRDAKRRAAGWYKLTAEQISDLFNSQKGKCFYCDKNLASYHIDHIIPIAKGGEHKLSNLVLSCPKCNLTKNSQDPEVFVEKIIEEKYGSNIKTNTR